MVAHAVSSTASKYGPSSEFILRNDARKSPNDPKLSDSGVRRGTCMVGGKAAVEAGAVTHGAVRCSAWLGPFDGDCVCKEIECSVVADDECSEEER